MVAENPVNSSSDDTVIFSYSRVQAIADGVLVDLTAWGRQTGFKFPVACTSTVWNGCIQPPPDCEGQGQSCRGRAHDLLSMLFCAIRRAGHVDTINFQVIFLMAGGLHETVTFKAVCGPGDDREPTITVMLPDED